MSPTSRLAFEECDFEIPQLRDLQIQRFVGFTGALGSERFETGLLTLSDGSVHSIYFSALLCHWTEMSTEEAAILFEDYGDSPQVDYAARFGLNGARIHEVRCVRADDTRVLLALDRGLVELVEAVPLDPQSEARIAFTRTTS